MIQVNKNISLLEYNTFGIDVSAETMVVYDSVGDFSAIAGAATADMKRTRKEHYGFAVDVAFITAYNSDPATLPSPILAFNVSSEDATYAKPVFVVNQQA